MRTRIKPMKENAETNWLAVVDTSRVAMIDDELGKSGDASEEVINEVEDG